MHEYEEYKEWTTFQSWLFIILLSGGLISYAMTMMALVKDVPREWEFGNIAFTPGESVYSTIDPDTSSNVQMIEPLPEGVSLQEEKKTKDEP